MEANLMKGLYAKLGGMGLSKKYVRSTLLPSWWDDEAAATPSGYSEALMLISRHVGVDIASLRSEKETARPAVEAPFKYKKISGTADEELTLARILATQVANLAALGAPPSRNAPSSAGEIRQKILEGGGCVDLESLLDFCWSLGIPVVHISAFPPKAKKMQGLAARVKGRPVIVVASQRKPSAWLLFILAHELGHVVLGHLATDQILVDEDIDQNDQDEEEKQANRFAVELLSGDAGSAFRAEGRWPRAAELAEEALRRGRQQGIDPGHVVLNYAHSMGSSFFAVANAALKILEPNPDAPGAIRRKLAGSLDWGSLPADSSEFLSRMTQAEPPMS